MNSRSHTTRQNMQKNGLQGSFFPVDFLQVLYRDSLIYSISEVHIGPFTIGVSFGCFARFKGFFFPVDFLQGLCRDSQRTEKKKPPQKNKTNRSFPQKLTMADPTSLTVANPTSLTSTIVCLTRFLRGAQLLFFSLCWRQERTDQ